MKTPIDLNRTIQTHPLNRASRSARSWSHTPMKGTLLGEFRKGFLFVTDDGAICAMRFSESQPLSLSRLSGILTPWHIELMRRAKIITPAEQKSMRHESERQFDKAIDEQQKKSLLIYAKYFGITKQVTALLKKPSRPSRSSR